MTTKILCRYGFFDIHIYGNRRQQKKFVSSPYRRKQFIFNISKDNIDRQLIISRTRPGA